MAEIDASPTRTIILGTEACWPLSWYYHGEDWKKLIYYATIPGKEQVLGYDSDIIIMHDGESYGELPGYTCERIVFKYWFDPNAVGMNPLEWVKYYFTRMFTLKPIGSINMDVFRKIA